MKYVHRFRMTATRLAAVSILGVAVLMSGEGSSKASPGTGFVTVDDSVEATCSDLTFRRGDTSMTGSFPLSIATADINGDGKQDWITANFASNNLTVTLGDGTGGVLSTSTVSVPATNPSVVVISDFNGDGKHDLVVTNSGSDNISILLGNGAGGFTHAANYFVGANPSAVAVADYNNDGTPDLAVANADSYTVSVLLGNGAGGFSAVTPNISAGFAPLGIASADFDGDGNKDLAIANFFYSGAARNVTILRGSGNGKFVKAGELYAGYQLTAITVGDLNNDGRVDIATANSGSWDISVFYNNGAGSFATQVLYDVGISPSAIIAADLNGDGKLDLAVPNYDWENVSILQNLGSSFAPARHILTAKNPAAVAATDINSDGRVDLLVANAGANNLTALLGVCDGLGSISGRVLAPDGRGVRNAIVTLTDPSGISRTTSTSSLGYYSYTDVALAQGYTISVRSKRYRFVFRTLTVSGDITDVDFVGLE